MYGYIYIYIYMSYCKPTMCSNSIGTTRLPRFYSMVALKIMETSRTLRVWSFNIYIHVDRAALDSGGTQGSNFCIGNPPSTQIARDVHTG